MINADALEKVKLKATPKENKQDRSAPNYSLALSGEVTQEKEEERRSYFFSTGLDRWYSSLKDKTFKTEFLDITPNEARAIIDHWMKHFKDRTSDDSAPDETSLNVSPDLKPLCNRIDDIVTSLAPTGKGVFIKLSTRSPKDSHIAFIKARKLFDERLPSLGQAPSANNKLILLQQAVIDSLNIKTGLEGVQLLMSSTRVGEDLEYALDAGDADFAKRCCLVLRQWVDIPLWAEFRGFVWNGKLTAIGQYNHPVVFAELSDGTHNIRSDLEVFYESIKHHIPIDRYIIDFAWTPDRVYLVEINPFDGEIVFPASTGLWNWDTDKDQMMNGPLELRVRHVELHPNALRRTTDPLWRSVLFN